MSATDNTYTVWVCVDCMVAREGEAPEDSDREPWNLIPGGDGTTVTLGLSWEEHEDPAGCEALFLAGGEPCGCERRDFSSSRCEGCGSTLGGSRHAYTVWNAGTTIVGYRTNENGTETRAWTVHEDGTVECSHAAPACCRDCVKADHRLFRNTYGTVVPAPWTQDPRF